MAEIRPKEPTESYTVGSYLLYKLDRTLAVVGIIVIAVFAIKVLLPPDAQQIAIAAVGFLGGYIGGRSGK